MAASAATTVVQESVQQMKQGLAVWLTQLGAGEVSREFFELIKNIGEAKSKQEEASIIEKQSAKLKSQISKNEFNPAGGDSRVVREMLVRLIYCEMLGTPVPFGYMTALNLTQIKSRIIDKRIGYVCVSLFLHPNHPMTTLCVNSFRRDLESTNQIELEMALVAMTQLLNSDAIPPVFNYVLKALEHNAPSVRKKAVTVLKKVIEIDDSYTRDVREPLRKAMCDIDPSVMAASLNVYQILADKDPNTYKDIIPSLVSILKQVIEHALSRDYDYHKVPAPWVQIKILKILSKLGVNDKKASEHMYEVVNETMKRADIGNSAGSAIVYECVSTITKIFPNNTLLDAAAENIASFIANKDHNLKYLGLKSLREIVNINPAYARNHQQEVLECLYDSDETIQRTTLELLYTMTNTNNVTVVVEKLTEHLKTTSDKYFKGDIVKKIIDLADKFSPDNQWFINTMNKVFLLGGKFVDPSVAYNLMSILGEGATGGEDEEADKDLRIFAVNAYFSIVEKVNIIGDLLTQTISWVLGEFAYLVGKEVEAIDVMVDLFDRPHEDEYIRVWIINSIKKLVAQTGVYPPHLQLIVEKYKNSYNVELQQRCCELEMLVLDKQLMNGLFPVDSSSIDLGVTSDLSFLDQWIASKIRNREVPTTHYQPSILVKKKRVKSVTKLNYVYKAPSGMVSNQKDGITGLQPSIFNEIPTVTVATTQETQLTSLSGVPGPWGATGWGAAKKLTLADAAPAPTSNSPTTYSGTSSSSGSSTGTPYVAPTMSTSSSSAVPATSSGPWGKSSTAETPKERRTSSGVHNELASQIFQFVDDGSRASSSRSGRGGRGGGTLARGASKNIAPRSSSSGVNLVDSGSGGSIYDDIGGSDVQSSTPTSTLSSDSGGLFAGVSINSTPTISRPVQQQQKNVNVPTNTANSAPTVATSLLVDFNMPISSSPQTITPITSLLDLSPMVSSSSTSSSGPLIAPTLSTIPLMPTQGTTDIVYQVTQNGNFDIPNLQSAGIITQKILGKNLQPTVNQTLHEDENLRISYVKILEPTSSSIAIFSSNKSKIEITELQFTITCPPSLKVVLPTDGSHVPVEVSTPNTLKLRVKSLPSGATSVLVSELQLVTWEYNLTTTVAASYSADDRVQYARFQVPIFTTDFVRPHVITIQVYGSSWKSFPKTASHTIPNKSVPTPEIYKKMVSDANFNVIDIKGMEVVSCAQVLPLSGNPNSVNPELILLYGKIAPGQLTITLKAQNQIHVDTVGTALKLFFAGK